MHVLKDLFIYAITELEVSNHSLVCWKYVWLIILQQMTNNLTWQIGINIFECSLYMIFWEFTSIV